MNDIIIRPAVPEDEPAAYSICLKTGDSGKDGEPFYRDDPDALGRLYVGPYFAFEPGLCSMVEDQTGICGYVLGALDSRKFYARYEAEWRPRLCAQFPEPKGDPAGWTRVQQIYHAYHHPEYFCPEPYQQWPSHLHIDLLPRVQRRGLGRQLLERLMSQLSEQGSPGVHLCTGGANRSAYLFYQKMGFQEVLRAGPDGKGNVYMARRLESCGSGGN